MAEAINVKWIKMTGIYSTANIFHINTMCVVLLGAVNKGVSDDLIKFFEDVAANEPIYSLQNVYTSLNFIPVKEETVGFDSHYYFTKPNCDPYNDTYYAALGMNVDFLRILKDEFMCNVWKTEFDKNYSIEEFKHCFNDVVKREVKGKINCRACGEYNDYAEIDGVIDDDKYTCWNCANNYYRVSRGLNVLDNNYSNQIMAIRKLNKVR